MELDQSILAQVLFSIAFSGAAFDLAARAYRSEYEGRLLTHDGDKS